MYVLGKGTWRENKLNYVVESILNKEMKRDQYNKRILDYFNKHGGIANITYALL